MDATPSEGYPRSAMHLLEECLGPSGRSLALYQAEEDLGKRGEVLAQAWVLAHDYVIVDTNVRLGRFEVDLIAYDNDTKELVFIEVKTRSTPEFGVMEAVHPRKLRKMRSAALRWLEDKPYYQVRFDVIGIVLDRDRLLDFQHVQGVDHGAH